MQGSGDVRVLLRKWREQYGLTQQTAAEVFGVPLNTYMTYENTVARSRRFDNFAAMLAGYGYGDLPVQEWRDLVFGEEFPLGRKNCTTRSEVRKDDGARMLRAFEDQFGLRGKQVADLLGVTYRTYCGWVEGRHVPPGHLLPLSLEALTVQLQKEKFSTSQ